MVGPKSCACICQICNCGRHRCPHNTRKLEIKGPCGVSEYTTKFVPYSTKPTESCKPPLKGLDTHGEMASETTHRVDYIPHPLSVQASCKKDSEYEPSTVAFDGLSTYNKEFTPKEQCRATPIKPKIRRGVETKFEGQPTYRTDYRQWDLEARKPPAATEWNPPTVRFNGLPTYTSDYVGHCAKPPQSFKPIYQYNPSDKPMSDLTDYKDAYRQHLNPDRARPVINKENTTKSMAPMECMSTHMKDYGWKTSAPPQSCKPPQSGVQSKEPFAADTTHRTDYREWPSDRAQVHPISQSTCYQPPKGEMSGDTTYTSDYVPHPGSRNQALGPKYSRQFDLPPFEGKSDYRDSYRPWSVVPRAKACGPNNIYRSPSVPFDGRSTNKQHYVPHWGHRPAESCKPQMQAMHCDSPFDDSTMYRADYTPKYFEPCPASLLNTKMSSYRFQQENEQGHLIYCRNVDESTEFRPRSDQMDSSAAISAPVAVAN
ncbi:hypothetical protein FBUS_00125 [Fasciolopsis buskii]|uniref:Stabilizer of axonemal microtubules 2 n=1 Tax=Fasciolopsis buskii TaxID=27845 RepID=A0A8E0RVR5_9TREM|nr:hypothetical protein FBUS_00125 [Fasciolopsis buski]